MIKRIFDIAGVILLMPIALVLIAAIIPFSLLFMGRPIFFFQERAGKGGVPFRMIKLRTMRHGEGSDAERLTRFGRFLRASSLDELPELWNVLKGEMSMVGPRPLPTRYLPRYTAEQNRRHEVLPGITGWAQVHGRNGIDWETKFRYDVDYVDSRSLWLDFKIVLMTIREVFLARGISQKGEATNEEFMQ